MGVRHYEAPLPPLLPSLRLPLFGGPSSPGALRADYHSAIDGITNGFTAVSVTKWVGGEGIAQFHNAVLYYDAPAVGGGGLNLQCPAHDAFFCQACNASWPPGTVANNNEALNTAKNHTIFDGSTHVCWWGCNPTGSAVDDIPANKLWVGLDQCSPDATANFTGPTVFNTPASARPVVVGFGWDESGWPWGGGCWVALFAGVLTLAQRTLIHNSGQLVPWASLPGSITGSAILWPHETQTSGTRTDRAGHFSLVEYRCSDFTAVPGFIGSIAAA